MTVGTLWAFLKLDDKQYNAALDGADKASAKATQSMQKKFTAMGGSLSKVGKKLSLFVTAPILAIGTAMMKTAINAEETAQKFEVVFNKVGDRANAAMNKLVNSYGMAKVESQDLLAETGDLLTGFGFTQDTALDLSLSVNELAADLASFKNFAGGAEGASIALTKAMLGESEQAKALGIVIRQDSDEYKDLVAYYMQAEGASLLQAKALTALKMAADQSKNAIGDKARTMDSAANIIKDTTADIKDLAVEMGTFLIPIVKDIVKKIRDLIDRFMNLSDSTKMTILKLAGLAAAGGPALMMLGNMIKSLKIIIPLMKVLFSPGGIIGVGIVALGLFVGQYAKWKKVQADNVALANENNEIIKGTIIGIQRVANALNLETAQRVYKLETMRAERELQLEMEIDSLAFAERAAKDQASYINAQGYLVGMTAAEIAAQKKAIPIHEQRIELLLKSLGIIDEAIGKYVVLDGVVTLGGETTKKTWQDINEEVYANIASENALIDKQAELAAALNKPFDVVKEKKKVLEEAIEFLMGLSAEEVNEPYSLTDQTVVKLISDIEALGMTSEETAKAQTETQEKAAETWESELQRLADERERKEQNAEAEIEREENLQATIAEIMERRREERLEAETAVEEAITQLKADEIAKQEKADKEAADKKKSIIQSVWDLSAKLASALTSFLSSQNKKEIAGIEEKYRIRLENAEGDADATKRIEDQMAAETLAIRQKEAKQARDIAIFGILLDTAQAVIKSYLVAPGPIGIALGVVAASIGALQLAAASNAPIPAFASGGWIGGASGEDQNIIRASRGEFMVNEGAASQNADLLEAINSGQSPSFQPIVAPVILDDQIVGQVLIDFIEGEASTGRLAIDPKAIRADV